MLGLRAEGPGFEGCLGTDRGLGCRDVQVLKRILPSESREDGRDTGLKH